MGVVCSGYGVFLAVNPGRTGTTWKPAPTARLRPDDPARGVCLTRVAPCKGRVGCKHCDSRMALAISAPLLAQIQTCICVSSSVTCVQKRTVSGQLVRIHCPNSQWSRRPLHARASSSSSSFVDRPDLRCCVDCRSPLPLLLTTGPVLPVHPPGYPPHSPPWASGAGTSTGTRTDD